MSVCVRQGGGEHRLAGDAGRAEGAVIAGGVVHRRFAEEGVRAQPRHHAISATSSAHRHAAAAIGERGDEPHAAVVAQHRQRRGGRGRDAGPHAARGAPPGPAGSPQHAPFVRSRGGHADDGALARVSGAMSLPTPPRRRQRRCKQMKHVVSGMARLTLHDMAAGAGEVLRVRAGETVAHPAARAPFVRERGGPADDGALAWVSGAMSLPPRGMYHSVYQAHPVHGPPHMLRTTAGGGGVMRRGARRAGRRHRGADWMGTDTAWRGGRAGGLEGVRGCPPAPEPLTAPWHSAAPPSRPPVRCLQRPEDSQVAAAGNGLWNPGAASGGRGPSRDPPCLAPARPPGVPSPWGSRTTVPGCPAP